MYIIIDTIVRRHFNSFCLFCKGLMTLCEKNQ